LKSPRLLEGFIVGARKLRKVERVYDAGCGHGLTGILLAYRFPTIQVILLLRAYLLVSTSRYPINRCRIGASSKDMLL
jgi:trans-aconitate methyltransferase